MYNLSPGAPVLPAGAPPKDASIVVVKLSLEIKVIPAIIANTAKTVIFIVCIFLPITLSS